MASKDFKVKNSIVVDDITIDLTPVSSYTGLVYSESTSSFTGTRDNLPIGIVRLWAAGATSATPPDDYLICNGATLSTTTYASLYAVIGDKFDTTAGAGEFNLPRFNTTAVQYPLPIGIDTANMSGATPVQTSNETTLSVGDSVSLSHTHTTGNDTATNAITSVNLDHTHNLPSVNWTHKHDYTVADALNTRSGGAHNHNTGNASVSHGHNYLSGNGNFIETAGMNAGHSHGTSDFIGGHSHTDQTANHAHSHGVPITSSNTHQHSFTTAMSQESPSHGHSVDATAFYFIIKYR